MENRDWLPRTLRVIAVVVLALCAIAMVLGWLPGTNVYRDSNDCFGQALGSLFTMEHGSRSPCQSHYVLQRVERAGDWRLMLTLAPVVLGALALRRWPRPWVAWLLAFGAYALLAIAIIVTFDLQIFSLEHRVALWPSWVISGIMALLAVILTALFIAMPIIGLMRWRARRQAERERVPEARVV